MTEKIFINTLQQRRIALEMSQEDLAKKTGINRSSISWYERSKKLPNIQSAKAYALASALECDVADICRVCTICGKPMGLLERDVCSNECYRIQCRTMRHCPVCGIEFEAEKDQILCGSKECKRKYLYRMQREGVNMEGLLSGDQSGWIKYGFEQSPRAQEMILESPDGDIYWIKNLRGFITEYQELFGEHTVTDAFVGIRELRSIMLRGDGQGSHTWQGWKLLGFRGYESGSRLSNEKRDKESDDKEGEPKSKKEKYYIKIDDYIGKTVGNFEILDRENIKGRVKAFVRCNLCGKEKWMQPTNILNGKFKSCGCMKSKYWSRHEQMMGQKIGRLTIKKLTKIDPAGRNILAYECECDCGNIVKVPTGKIGKSTNSCGCIKRELLEQRKEAASVKKQKALLEKASAPKRERKLKIDEYIGKTVGNFQILDRRNENGIAKALAKCKFCGTEKWMEASPILSGTYKSCGCTRVDSWNRYEEMVGKKYDRLMIRKLTKADVHGKRVMAFECECDCGNVVYVEPVRIGAVKSCGCLLKEVSAARAKASVEKMFFEGTNPHSFNAKMPSTNTSGCKGVAWNKNTGRWRAFISFQKHKYFLGEYSEFQDAVVARKKAENELFGDFLAWLEKEHPERYARIKNAEVPPSPLDNPSKL